jgi:ABC-type amino acid transport substrate-binding protein
MDRPTFLLPLLVALLLPAVAAASELVVLIDTATEMPLARFEQGKLVEGIHKDIGDLLAQKMGRTPRFLAVPRKRIVMALETGDADVLCSYVPEWLEGAFDWSKSFIPIAEVLVADLGVRRPQSIADVAGKPVGTVLGFSHPELETVLGKNFVRDDAPNSESNLRKLSAGRVRYAVFNRAYFEYRLKTGDPPLWVHPPLLVKSYAGQCAVSRHGRVTVGEVDQAIDQVVRDGAMNRIMQHYR